MTEATSGALLYTTSMQYSSNVKVKFSLCLTKSQAMKTYPLLNYHDMNMYGRVMVQLHVRGCIQKFPDWVENEIKTINTRW